MRSPFRSMNVCSLSNRFQPKSAWRRLSFQGYPPSPPGFPPEIITIVMITQYRMYAQRSFQSGESIPVFQPLLAGRSLGPGEEDDIRVIRFGSVQRRSSGLRSRKLPVCMSEICTARSPSNPVGDSATSVARASPDNDRAPPVMPYSIDSNGILPTTKPRRTRN